MASTLSSSAPLTKAAAWKSYSKLLRRATPKEEHNDHHRRFLTVAARILTLHPVPESSEDTPAELDDARDVEETLRESLDPPATVFGDEFFTSALYPLSLLYNVGGLYKIQHVDPEYSAGLPLTEAEKADKYVQAVYWLCNMLNMSPTDSRVIIEEFKDSRQLTGTRTEKSIAAPASAATPTPPTSTAAPDPLTQGLPQLPPENRNPPADSKNIDVGRQERFENLHHRNRRESVAQRLPAHLKSLQARRRWHGRQLRFRP